MIGRPFRVCGVPVVVGNYLVESIQSGHAVVCLDMSDPEHPREAGRIVMGPEDAPHWIAVEPGRDRLVITGVGALSTRVLFATINRETGELKLDPQSIDSPAAGPMAGKEVPFRMEPSSVTNDRPHRGEHGEIVQIEGKRIIANALVQPGPELKAEVSIPSDGQDGSDER